MTPDLPQNDRDALEAKLTALLLGELSAHEAAALHSAMDDDPDLAELYERLKQTIDLVRASAATQSKETGPQPAPLKLSADRREKLLAHFKTVKPKEFAEPPQKSSLTFLIQVAAVVAIVAMLAAMLLPALSKAKSKAMRPMVLNNLRLLDGAKQTWALDLNKSANTVATYNEVEPYFGRGADDKHVNLSVAGESYLPGKVGESPAVEMSASQARKMFGPATVARGETHDGKVRLSMAEIMNQPEEYDTRPNQQNGELALNRAASQIRGKGEDSRRVNSNIGKQLSTIIADSSAPKPAAAPARTPEPKTEIVLPSSNENEVFRGPFPAIKTPESVAASETFSYKRDISAQSYGPAERTPLVTNVAVIDSWVPTNANPDIGAFAFGNSATPVAGIIEPSNNPAWSEILQNPSELHSADNRFVSRFANTDTNSVYLGVAGTTIAANGSIQATDGFFLNVNGPVTNAIETLNLDGGNETNLLGWTHSWNADVSGVTNVNSFDATTGFPVQYAASSDISDSLKRIGTSNDQNGLASNFGVSTRSMSFGQSGENLDTNVEAGTLTQVEVTTVSGRESKHVPVVGYNPSEQSTLIAGNSKVPITGRLPVPFTNSFSSYDASSNDAVPLLGDLPTVGRLYRSTVASSNGNAVTNGQFYTSLSREDAFKLRDITASEPSNAFGGFGKPGFSFFNASTNSVVTVDPNSRNVIITADDETTKQLLAEIKKLDSKSPQQTSTTPESVSSGARGEWHGGAMLGPIPATSPPPPQPQQMAKAEIVLPAAQESSPLIAREQEQYTSQPGGFGGGGGFGPAAKKPSPTKGGKQVELAANNSWSWTVDNHNKAGNILLQDDSVQQKEIEQLRSDLQTNHDFQPVYNFYDDGDGYQTTNSIIAAKPQGTFPGQTPSNNIHSAHVVGYATVLYPTNNTFAVVASPPPPASIDLYTGGHLMDKSVTASGGSQPEQTKTTQLAEAQQDDIKTAIQHAPYYAAMRKLQEEQQFRQILAIKTSEEEVEKELPGTRMVTIVDSATAASTEKPTFSQRLRQTFSGNVERSAQIIVEQDRPDISGLAGPGNVTGYDPYFLQTEFQAIQSRPVLDRAAKSLKLDQNGQVSDDTIAKLKKELDLRPVANSKLIEIGAKSKTAEDAARTANAVAQAYKEYRLAEWEGIKERGIKSLNEQLTDQDKKVELAQAKVDDLRKKLNFDDSSASIPSILTSRTVSELTASKIQREADYNQQKTLLEKLKALDRVELRKTLPLAVTDTQLNTLLGEQDLAEQNFLKLKADYNPTHPKVLSAKAAVDDLNGKVDDRINGIMIGLQAAVDSSKARLDALNAQSDTALPKPTVPPPTPQPEILTSSNAFSTFSMNVSDVSFKLAAASLEKGQMPDPGSIRSEEFINAFDYRDPEAALGTPVAFNSERARYPFAHNRELLRFSLKTAAAGRQQGRPLNIVLLLDNSGSMERADRVRIIQEALRVLAAQLQPQDTFSIVTFARTARLRVDGIPGNQAAAAAEEIAKLTPEGGTNLGDALDLAYETALHHYLAGGDNRVVMLTDGAANLGEVNPDSLKSKVVAHRQQGISLDCFGIGWEGYNDDLLEVLTRDGDGRYGFINTPEEASTEFATQIAGALHVAAQDVKVQVEFNPARVTSYRQIGYAKHQLTKEQFRDNTVAAAQIAAQEAGNALYTVEINPQGEGSIGTVHVRYRIPGTSDYREQQWDVPYTGGALPLETSSPAMRLAATASAFSEWLTTSPFADQVSTDQLLNYLNGIPQIYGVDTRPQKLEWMIRQARSISGK